MASRNSNTTQQTSDQQLLAGLQMNQAALPASWNLLGATYTLAQLITMLTTRVAAVAAVATAKAAYAAAVLAADNERTTTKSQVDAVRQQIRVWSANKPDVLAEYGLTVAKAKGVKSPVTKVVAAAKAKATRAARGTKGTVERSKIEGSVPEAIAINTQTQELVAEATASREVAAPAVTSGVGSGTPHPPTGA